jgi:hypothetical protein
MMQKRILGDLEVSALGYGYLALETVYGPATDRQEGLTGRRAVGSAKQDTSGARLIE